MDNSSGSVRVCFLGGFDAGGGGCMNDKFPPLPEPDVEEWSESCITLRCVGWSKEQVEAYAEAVRKQALEDAYSIYVTAQELSHIKDGLRELLK